MKEIIIQLSKKKLALLFFGAIGFIIACFWSIQTAETKSTFNTLYLKISSTIGIIFFGFCGIYAIEKFFDKRPGLVINNEGIIDNSSFVCAGLIKWETITNVAMNEIFGQTILTIEVNNADEIISKQNTFKKIFMNLSKNYFNSPIQISSIILKKYDFRNLYNLINERLTHRTSTHKQIDKI